MISYSSTPIVEIRNPIFEKFQVRVYVKREDQNHPLVSGNKWWKLKYNLLEAKRLNSSTLITFGGAYSNHIWATAAAGKEAGFNTIGIIRGEETQPINETLSFAKSCGMQIHYVSREMYRKKREPEFLARLEKQWSNFYLISEGGTNTLAVKGCEELAKQLCNELDFDYLCLPVGTGGTISGMIEGLDETKKIIGFAVLKGASFLESEIDQLLSRPKNNWALNVDYHFGGYAKTTKELKQFCCEMAAIHQLPLDEIYTGKMVYAVFDLIQKNFFKKESKIVLLHTGGIQTQSVKNTLRGTHKS